jgi:prepilin signal peptidase PulO-like enzyme (type II secretory pathway)
MPDLSLIPPAFGYVLAGIFGAIIGSFLNVVIHRVPLDESIVFPNSRCPSCGAVIAFYDNIPVLSYVLLGAKCRSCKEHISIRYPAVELLTAALFVAVAWHDGLSVALPFDLVFASALFALVFIDAEHMILPNVITYPGIVFAVVARIAIPFLTRTPHFDDLPSLLNGPFAGLPIWVASLGGAVIGGLIGGGSLWLMGWIWQKSDRWRLAVVDGMDLAKGETHRRDGPGRREDDVHGRRLSRLASDARHDLYRRAFRIGDRNHSHDYRRTIRFEKRTAVRHLPWHWRNRFAVIRIESDRVVSRAAWNMS